MRDTLCKDCARVCHPTYSDEFKADAVNLVLSSGRSPAAVAPELGISVTALKRWVQLLREGEAGVGGKPDDPGSNEYRSPNGIIAGCLSIQRR